MITEEDANKLSDDLLKSSKNLKEKIIISDHYTNHGAALTLAIIAPLMTFYANHLHNLPNVFVIGLLSLFFMGISFCGRVVVLKIDGNKLVFVGPFCWNRKSIPIATVSLVNLVTPSSYFGKEFLLISHAQGVEKIAIPVVSKRSLSNIRRILLAEFPEKFKDIYE